MSNPQRVELRHGDCIELMRQLPDNLIDSIVTDPPYGLEFMGKEWDAPWKSEASHAEARIRRASEMTTESKRRFIAAGVNKYEAGTGFQAWFTEVATEALRVLKPGGHLLAFGGTRTYHRLAVAIEDAGFEIRDSMIWLYGSGFPKSHDVSKGIDKVAGAKREVIGTKPYTVQDIRNNAWESEIAKTRQRLELDITAPATPAAQQWSGWGTALKPAHEPIVVARKPLIGTVAENVLEWGVGAMNIDGCRIGNEQTKTTVKDLSQAHGNKFGIGGIKYPKIGEKINPPGRWPANVVLSHTVFCDDTCAEGCPVAELDKQNEGASRFFYVAKASKRERPKVDGVAHPTVKPLALMRWLVRLVTPPNGTVLEPFAGSGTTVEAALLEGFSVLAFEKTADYLPLIRERVRRTDTGVTN